MPSVIFEFYKTCIPPGGTLKTTPSMKFSSRVAKQSSNPAIIWQSIRQFHFYSTNGSYLLYIFLYSYIALLSTLDKQNLAKDICNLKHNERMKHLRKDIKKNEIKLPLMLQ